MRPSHRFSRKAPTPGFGAGLYQARLEPAVPISCGFFLPPVMSGLLSKELAQLPACAMNDPLDGAPRPSRDPRNLRDRKASDPEPHEQPAPGGEPLDDVFDDQIEVRGRKRAGIGLRFEALPSAGPLMVRCASRLAAK